MILFILLDVNPPIMSSLSRLVLMVRIAFPLPPTLVVLFEEGIGEVDRLVVSVGGGVLDAEEDCLLATLIGPDKEIRLPLTGTGEEDMFTLSTNPI